MRDLVITAVLAAVLGGGGAWTVQGWRYGDRIATMEKEYAQAMQKAESDARAKEQRMQQENERIFHEATEREKKLASSAVTSKLVTNSLRSQIQALNARPAPADPSSAAYAGEATTARELLGTCATEYRAVAEGADELRNQVTGLQDWVGRVCKGNQK